MATVNLTKQDNRTSVNLTKGVTPATLLTAVTEAQTSAGTATTQAASASSSATASQLRALEAEAEKMTADSYATEPEDVVVKTYTSDGDGTFTATATTEYSALHWNAKAQATDYNLKVSKTDVIGAIGNINNPLLDLPLNNSLAMKQGVGSVTFTRASTATYIDRYGVLQTASIDEPRFEKDGLLIEGASTNLCPSDSNSFDTTGTGVIVGTDVGVDGVATTATTVEVGVGGAVANGIYTTGCRGQKLTSISKDGTEITTDSIFVKAISTSYTTYVFFRDHTNAHQIRLTLVADANGVFTISDALTQGVITDVSYGIKYMSNGWCRVYGSFKSNLPYTQRYAIVNAGTQEGNKTALMFWQLEDLPFATSYIPTTTTAVTRATEICDATINGNIPNLTENFAVIADVSFLNAVKGGYFPNVIDIGAECSISFSPVSGLMIYEKGSVPTTGSTVLQSGTTHRVLLSSASIQYLDGVAEVTNTTSNTIALAPRFRIGRGYDNSLTMLNGHIKNIRVYDQELTPTEASLA